MKPLFSIILLAFLGFKVPVQAELHCKCDHLPIKPKQCVNLCFGALLNSLPQERLASLLDLDAQLSSNIAAAKRAGQIEVISDLRSRLPESDFERLESKIEAAASGNTRERAALNVQFATLSSGSMAPDHPSTPTEDQIAAINDEAERESTTGTYTGTTGTTETTSAAGTTGSLPRTASDVPLLALLGGIFLAVSLALRGYRKHNHSEIE